MRIVFPWNKREKEKYFIAVDLGTETVKTIIFKTREEKIIILGSAFQSFEKFALLDLIAFGKDIFKKTVLTSIIEASQKITEKIPKIETLPLLLGLPADILKTRIFSQSFKRLNPKVEIREKEEKEIYQKILKDGEKALSEIFNRSFGILPEDLQILKLEISEIKIDGYEVPYLKGFKGENLDFKLFSLFLPKYYFKEFKNIFKEMGFENSQIVCPAQNLKFIIGPEINDGIFIDIGGTITQIFILKNKKLVEISEFNIGGKNFSQAISQTLGISEKTSQIFKEQYCQKFFSEEVRKRIREIIFPIVKNWFKDLKFKLNEYGNFPLPSHFLLFGGGSLLPEIQEILEEAEGWEDFVFFDKIKVKLVYPKDFKNIEDKTHTLNSPQWISSILICYG